MFGEGRYLHSGENPFLPISIVIPAHNEEKYLGATLESLRDAVEELNVVAEIIVVNDGSTDQTAEIARQADARVINVELRNIGAVRNAGAAAAIHPWLLFVDADTLVPAKTLGATLVQLANGDSGGGACVDIPDKETLHFFKVWIYYAVVSFWQVLGGWAAGCYMYCRKDLFDSFGGFDESYFAAEEYFFSKQLKTRGNFRLVRTPVLTSARKLHGYSIWQLMRFLLLPLISLSMFRSRFGLELLYQDRR